MSWDTGAGGGDWSGGGGDAGVATDNWGSGGDTGVATDNWNGGGDTGVATDNWGSGGGADTGNANANGGKGSGDDTCRICHQIGHFSGECPDKPEGYGLTGECFNCGEVGHNKADCTNPKVDRPFTGTCNGCGEEGHSVRNCPQQTCKLCNETGHKALECKSRRIVNWTGVPELSSEAAWTALVDAAKLKDLDTFRVALKAYARALNDGFDITAVECALRDDNLPIFLIAKKQPIEKNMTIVDLIGNPEREFVLSIQTSAKPRRLKMKEGWPATPEENLERLKSCGLIHDRGVPVCSNCNELGHIKKHCKEEQPEHENHTPAITCVYCTQEGHRARDCPQPRVNKFACKNCGKEGHKAAECEEPRSAANVECRKCNEMGHFSKDCPNEKCRNCDQPGHNSKDCDQPRNPATVTCRNCEVQGHFSRNCPDPKDWRKVQCSNCQEFGHTIKRCKVPIAGGPVETAGEWNNGGGGEAAPATSGKWDNGDGGGW